MDPQKRHDLYLHIVIVAIAAIVMAWVSYTWTASTGLTFASRSQRGRAARPEDEQRSKHLAVLMTAVGGPVALWAEMQRRRGL